MTPIEQLELAILDESSDNVDRSLLELGDPHWVYEQAEVLATDEQVADIKEAVGAGLSRERAMAQWSGLLARRFRARPRGLERGEAVGARKRHRLAYGNGLV